MTLSKLLRLAIPAMLVFAFAAPAWADGNVTHVRKSVALKALRIKEALLPAVVKPGKTNPVAKRPALPIRKQGALLRR